MAQGGVEVEGKVERGGSCCAKRGAGCATLVTCSGCKAGLGPLSDVDSCSDSSPEEEALNLALLCSEMVVRLQKGAGDV